jgi:hypothetical protein
MRRVGSLGSGSARTTARGALAGAALGALAWLAAGCEEAPPPEEKPREARVMVKLSFDETVYVDAATRPQKLAERLRHQTQSIFPALQKADITVAARKQSNIDVSSLSKDKVTVVDTATGITRSALRVRYHFVAAALAPKGLASKRVLDLGVLHDVNASRADAILKECTANGDRERGSLAEPWVVFDPSLPGCGAAMAREGAAVAAARKTLEHPTRELASIEFERSYLPVHVQLEALRPSFDKPGNDEPAGSGAPDEPPPPPGVAEAPPPTVPDEPGAPAPAAPRAPGPAAPAAAPVLGPAQGFESPLLGGRKIAAAPAPIFAPPGRGTRPAAVAPDQGARGAAPLAPVSLVTERDLGAEAPSEDRDRGAAPSQAPGVDAPVEIDDDLLRDEKELFEGGRSAAAFNGVGDPAAGVPAPSGSHTSPYLQPNFAIVYVAIAAVAALLVGKGRRAR